MIPSYYALSLTEKCKFIRIFFAKSKFCTNFAGIYPKMTVTNYYKVAGHTFGVSGEAGVFALMSNYEPFVNHGDRSMIAAKLHITRLVPMIHPAPEYTEEMRQEDEGQTIICGHTAAGEAVFEFYWHGETAGWLVCSDDYSMGRLITTGRHEKMAIDNALMILFALATADKKTVLFHAAVVSHEGRGYLFLGPSGTGKSTHARLWLQHIGGAELVNDDNPVVRIAEDGSATVYGSPWSGKTPCYRNVSCLLGGIVVLSQAPYNRIQRLNGIEAYVALVTSISGQRWDEGIADGLHDTENQLVSTVPMWHLECLPDEAAARLCCSNIKCKDCDG